MTFPFQVDHMARTCSQGTAVACTVAVSIMVFVTAVASNVDNCGKCKCVMKNGMMSVNCSNLNLSEIPDFESSNQLVENLYFSRNNIIVIKKDSLSHLTNLSLLQLDFNKISTIEPAAFLSLKKLADLELNENLLTVIKSEIFQDLPSLSTLRLGYNRIATLEKNAFLNLPKLTMIDFTNNSLTFMHGESLNNLPSLTTLFLRGNQFSLVPKEVCEKLPALKRLYLKTNNISAIHKLDFAQCFNLTYLQLAENQIEAMHEYGFISKMSDVVIKPLPLETIDLTQNKLSSFPTPPLRHVPTLKHLGLGKNMFRIIPAGAFERLPYLTIVHLSNSVNLETIEPGAFRGLFNLAQLYMKNNKKLRNIPDYAFQDSKRLGSVLIENNSLETLHKNMLHDWTRLQLLNIQSNKFKCSCDLVWMKKSKMLQNAVIFDMVRDIKCTTNGTTKKVLDLDPVKLECTKHGTKSRVVTGLIAAGVTACIMLAFLAAVSFRRRIYSKYIHLKYHRQKDDLLFTVEDTKAKRKIFSKLEFRDQARDETLM